MTDRRTSPTMRAHCVSSMLAIALSALVGVGACTSILGNDFEVGGEGGAGAGQVGGAGAGGEGAGTTGGGGSDLCGNGHPDPGELCDGDCPEQCIDVELCTDDHMVGSPDDCNAECPFEWIDTCVNSDGCCPDGCYNSIDSDCTPRVLIVTNDANGSPALQGALQEQGVFGTVDVHLGATGALTMADLLQHDVVLVYANYGGFNDPAAIGDLLADYHDAGGRVVVANGANCTSYAIAGRFVAQGYLALGIGPIYPNPDPLGPVETPNTPLLVGVSSLDAQAHCATEEAPDAFVVARYADTADPIVAYHWMGPRRRVDLNVFPSPSATGVVELVTNALLFQ